MEIVEITIIGSGAISAPTARLQIAPTDLFVDLRSVLLECSQFCTLTAYHFEFEGSICSDYEQIGPDRRQFRIVESPYTFTTIREHVQRFQDLLQHPVQNLSIENWLKHLVETNKTEANDKSPVCPIEFSVVEACEQECEPNDVSSSALLSTISIRKSDHDPPTGSRRLQGDLIYLDIRVDKHTVLHVTGSQAFFCINKTRDDAFDPSCKLRNGHRSTTLAALLAKCNPAFRTKFSKVMSESCALHPLIQAPSPVLCAGASMFAAAKDDRQPVIFDGIKTERNWNDEFLVWSEQPAEHTAENALTRFRNQYKTYADFINAAIAGSMAVLQGEVAPLNVNEPQCNHVYLHDNIFFSVAIDARGIYAEYGGDLTAHKFALHDMHAAHLIAKATMSEMSDAKLHTLLSVVVDYAGVRLSCQGIIPGILNGGGSTLLFGSIDQSPEGTQSMPAVMPHANKTDIESFTASIDFLAERFHWTKSDVLDSQGNILEGIRLPMDCKGLSTADGRNYLLDLIRITPRDANFPNTLSSVLRLELVNRWCHNAALEKVLQNTSQDAKSSHEPVVDVGCAKTNGANTVEQSQRKPSSGEDAVSVSACDPRVINVSDIELAAAACKFNLNCLTQFRLVHDSGEDAERLKILSYSIHEQAIPAIFNDILSFSHSCIDSRATASLFHSHGVNMRYLGFVHTYIIEQLVENQPDLCTTLATCIYREILVRTCKHLLNAELRSLGAFAPVARAIVAFLNNILQRNPKNKNKHAFLMRVHTEMAVRFSYRNDGRVDCSPAAMSVLSGICQAIGLTIRLRNYDFSETGNGITADDLLDMKPVPKFHLPESIDTMSVLATARSKMANDDQSGAHEILSHLIQVLCSVTGSIHPDIAEAYSMFSLISYRCGDTFSAIDHSYRVILIYERLYGCIDGELARAHSQHALFLMCGGFHKRALKHARKAKQMFELLGGPNYPETATAMLNIGVILVESGRPMDALEVQLHGLSQLQNGIGADSIHLHFITAFHGIAFSYAILRQFRDAVQYEKRARAVAQALGNDPLVSQCNSWLAMFTKGAVLAAKNDPQQITVEPTAAALSWIASPQLARPSSFAPVKEIVYFNNDTIQQLQQTVEERESAGERVDSANPEAENIEKFSDSCLDWTPIPVQEAC